MNNLGNGHYEGFASAPNPPIPNPMIVAKDGASNTSTYVITGFVNQCP
jgi:hypothetical protein